MFLFEGCVISVFILCVLFLHIRSLPLASYLTFMTLILIYLNICLLVVVEVFIWSVGRENRTLDAVVLPRCYLFYL